MNSLVTQYRDYLKQSGKSDPRSDVMITLALGSDAKKRGVLDQQPQDFRDQFLEIEDSMAPTIGEEFAGGLKRGVRGLGATATGFGALVADWLPGEGTDRYIRDPLLKKTQELEAGEPGDVPAPTWDDVHSPKSLARYLAAHTGNAVPSVAESILVSLAAGVAGSAAGPEGTAAGVVGGLVAREAVKDLAKSKLRRIIIAQGANSLALSSGEIYSNLANDEGVDKETARNMATGLGVLAAIPDTILPSYVASKFLKPAEQLMDRAVQKRFLIELGKEAAKVVPGEGSTEAFQEWVGILAGKLSRSQDIELSDEDWKQMREAAVGGAVGGLLMAPVAAAGEVREAKKEEAPKPAATPRQAAPIAADPVAGPTLADVKQSVLDMTDDQRSVRLAGLVKRGDTLTDLEKEELRLLGNMQASAPAAAPAAAAPIVTPAPAPVTPAPASVAPAPVVTPAPAETPVVTPPPAPETAVIKPLSPEAIIQRVENISKRLERVTKRGGDDRAARGRLESMVESSSFTREGLDELEAEVTKQELAAVSTVAKVKAGKANLIADREKIEAANIKAEIAKKRNTDTLARLRKNLTALAQGSLVTEDGAGSAPNPRSGEEVAAPALAPLAAGRMIEPHAEFSPDPEQAKKADWQGIFTAVLGLDKAKSDKGAGLRRKGSNARQSTVGIALLDPKTGQVHLRGLLGDAMPFLSTDGKMKSGMAVQAMGRDGGTRTEKVKLVATDGSKPVLLSEIIDAGFIPVGRVNFENAGKINQDFASREAFIESAKLTDIAGVQGEESDTKSKSLAENDAAAVTSDPLAAGAIIAREQQKNNPRKRKSDSIGKNIIANSQVADLAGSSLDDEGGVSAQANFTNPVASSAPAIDEKPASAYGNGPWEIQHRTKGGWKTLAKIKSGKDSAIVDGMSKVIKGKTGSFRLVNADGEHFNKTTQRKTKTRKPEAKSKPSSMKDMRYAYKLLSEVTEGSESPNWMELLHTRMRGLDEEQTDALVRDFLMGRGSFKKRLEGSRFADVVGGIKQARRLLIDSLDNYEQLTRPEKGSVSDKGNRRAGARRGSRDAAVAGATEGAGRGEGSAGTESGGARDEGGSSVGRGSRGKPDGSERSNLDGRELGAELTDAEIKGVYKSIEVFGRGVFDADLLNRYPAEIREVITTLLAERGMEWDEFQHYIQNQFDASNTAEEFLAAVRGEEPPAGADDHARVSKSVLSLTEQLAIAKEDLANGEAKWKKASLYDKQAIGKRNGNLARIVDLLSDAVDAESMTPPRTHVIEDRLESVADIRRKQDGEDIVGGYMSGIPPGMAIQLASDEAMKYGESLPAHEMIGGVPAENVINPLTGRLENPNVLPDTSAAAMYNLDEAERRGRQEKAVDPSAPASFAWVPANDITQKARDQVASLEAILNDELRAGGEPTARLIPVLPPEAAGSSRADDSHQGLVSAIRAIGRVFNKEIVFVEIKGGVPGTSYMGLTDSKGVIVINKDSRFSALQVAGHELTHGLAEQRPDLYDKLESFVREWAPMPPEYERRKAGTYTEDEIMTEWVSDVVGERFSEPAFWDAMQKYSAKGITPEQRSAVMSLSTWMGAWVRRILSAITRQLGGTSIHIRDLARTQDVIADIMGQYAATADYAKAMKAEVAKVNKSTTREVEYVEASAQVQAAAWNELLELIGQQNAMLMPKDTLEDFWRMVSRGEPPTVVIDAIEKRVPGSTRTRISDSTNTPAMKSQMHLIAYKLARKLEVYARAKSARAVEAQQALSDRLEDLVARFRKSEKHFMDASAMQASLLTQLKEILTETSKDIGRIRHSAFSHGELTEAVRQLEGLKRDELIPEEYQRVFRNIIASDGTSIFDHLSAMAQLNLPLREMTAPAIVEAMSKSGIPRLTELTSKQRPLAVALAVLSRNAAKDMDLLQLRLLKDSARSLAIKQGLDAITQASDERLDAMWPALSSMINGTDLAGRLQAAYVQDRKAMRRTRADLLKAGERARINRAFADAMGEKRAELGKASGDFASWVPADGGKYSAMRFSDKGTWLKVERNLRMAGPEVTDQHGQLSQDLASNRAWMKAHPDQRGTPLWNEIELHTMELSKLDVSRKIVAADRWFFDKLISPLGQKFAQMGGLPGQAINQMLQRYQFITKSARWHDGVTARSKKWDRALLAVVKAAGFKSPQEFAPISDQVIYHIESNPGKEEAAAIRDAVRAARRRLPADNVVAEDFGEKLGEYLRQTKSMSEYMLGIAEENGVHIEDGEVKNLMRNAVQYGWLTVSRKLRTSSIVELKLAMDEAGWGKQEEGAPPSFTPDVVRLGIEPFIMKPGKEVFFGANRTDGRWSFASQVQAQNVWQRSAGDVEKFIENMFLETYEPSAGRDHQQDRAEYRQAMVGRIEAMLGMIVGLEKKVNKPGVFEKAGPLPHRMMDGRTNDLIPPEFFQYDSFDTRSAEIQLSEIGYHAAFGRNNQKFDAALEALNKDLTQRVQRYQILSGVTEAQKRANATARGWDWNSLKTASRDLARINSLSSAFGVHFGGNSVEMGSERALLEFLQTQAALVLNQPTSGLWNIPSILDFPLVIGGGMGVRASGRSLKHLMNGVFGSALGAVNINILRAATYQAEIVQARQGEQGKLTFGEQTADVGRNSAYFEGGVGNRSTQVSKFIQNAMKKGVSNKTGQSNFNGLWAPFQFLSEQVATAVATANVENFELMVKRTMDFFKANADALNDPSYKVTAKDLGMTGPAFFSDERAFDYYRSKAYEYGMGGIEDIARAALEKDGRLLTDEQVLSVAQMAFNEISMESSINSRPIEFTNNPILRYGGMLLGWPIAKMHQVNVAFKTVDGQKDLAAAARAIGVLAAWSLPMGLAFSFMMDEWDEEVVGKRSNRREIDKIAGVPVIGPLLALTTGDRGFKGNLFGMLERSAKAGNIYGLGADFVNSAVNIVDPTAGQRDFSLDSRVLAFSQFANLRDMLRNFIHQDFTYTYESVGRPLVLALGGNGLIQAQQIMNTQLNLDNTERWIAERISVGNYLRSAGREAGLELKAGAGRSSPTPLSVWERQMWLSALGNDRTGFLEAWRAAVAAARKQGSEDPENTVLQAWRGRNPVTSVFRTKPTDEEMIRLMRAMNDDGRQAVRDAVRLYEEYSDFLAPSPFEKKLAAVKPYKPRPAATLFR